MKVKSCWLIEGGMAYRPHWIGGCCTSTAIAPFFYEGEAMESIKRGRVPTLDEIVGKRKELFEKANDPKSGIPCLKCAYLVDKEQDEVSFDKLAYVDLQHYSMCNNRCTYCYYAQKDLFVAPQYDVLRHLSAFASAGKVKKGCIVLFNGGEPALLKDFGRYMDFFTEHRIDVELYTNATIFREEIFEHIARGTIIRTNISIDAGNASTYRLIHGTDSFERVIENVSKYSHAAEKSGAAVQAKYIFTEQNSDPENVVGFVHAMAAVRPQVVHLTMNFEHLVESPDSPSVRTAHCYDREVEGYAQMYVAFKKFGLEAHHLLHYITLVEQGAQLSERIMARIRELEAREACDPRSTLRGFRREPFRRRHRAELDRLLPPGSMRRSAAVAVWRTAQRELDRASRLLGARAPGAKTDR
jgi:sulfatase maturation enzyme AslB (radical SAM superfamily)